MTTTPDITDIDALIADAAADLPPVVMKRLVTARNAIVANADFTTQNLLDILSPPAVAPDMTAAQQARLKLAQLDANAAGTTITHTVLPDGAVLVVDTDPSDGQVVAGIIDRVGNLDL